MNTTEQIVEAYFRICKECLTVPDVKVVGAYARQLDMLAYSLRLEEQYHIEVSVSHVRQFAPTTNKLLSKLAYKFLGVPNLRELRDRKTKKSYIKNIHHSYRLFGMSPSQIKRVWVCWERPKNKDFDAKLKEFNEEHELDENPIEVISFKEIVIPALKARTKTAHYDDVALRTISLFKQGKSQNNIDYQKARQRRLHED